MKNVFKSSKSWWRKELLKTALIAIKQYAKTKDEKFKEHSILFSKRASDYKTDDSILPE